MAAKLEKTKTPGVYRRGKSYVVIYPHHGVQRKRCVRTYDEARAEKGKLTAEVASGEHRALGRITVEA